MAQWQRKISLLPEWGQAQNEEITPAQLAAVVAKRLGDCTPFTGVVEETRLDLIKKFKAYGKRKKWSFSTFNHLMDDLYDWADMKLDNEWNGKKVAWIETF